MSSLPDVALQQAILSGFKQIRQEPKFLDLLFPDSSQEQMQQLRNFFLNESIAFKANFPRAEELTTPAIVMLLRSESEAETFLGNHICTGSPAYPFLNDTGDGQGASISDVEGLPPKIVGGLEVETSDNSSGQFTTITFEDEWSKCLSDALTGLNNVVLKAYVIAGTGAGQSGTITRLSYNSLDIDGVFSVNLDSTSLIDIRLLNHIDTVAGQPSKIYEEDSGVILRRLGANFKATYQFTVVGGSQLEVVFLYSILKAVLYSQHLNLEKMGIQALSLSGTEFSPRNDYLPSTVYQRSLTAQFIYTFSTATELKTFKEIQMDGIFPTVVGRHNEFHRIEFDLEL